MKIDYSKRKHESPFDDDPSPSEIHSVNDLPKPPPVSQPKTFRPHSDSERAQFRVFMAAVLLTFGVPVSVWAYWCLAGKEYHGQSDRQWIEGSLCAIASLICFISTGYLLVRSRQIFRQIKANKLNYEPLDREKIPVLKNAIKVESTKFQDVLIGFLILFFGGTSLLFLANAVREPRNLILVLFNLSILFVICRLIFIAKKKSVRWFNPEGILRGDLRLIPWKDFRGAITQISSNRFGAKYNWRTDIIFADGSEAWIMPQRIKNHAEVYRFVETLPQPVLRDAA